jgi:hypothetical protein
LLLLRVCAQGPEAPAPDDYELDTDFDGGVAGAAAAGAAAVNGSRDALQQQQRVRKQAPAADIAALAAAAQAQAAAYAARQQQKLLRQEAAAAAAAAAGGGGSSGDEFDEEEEDSEEGSGYEDDGSGSDEEAAAAAAAGGHGTGRPQHIYNAGAGRRELLVCARLGGSEGTHDACLPARSLPACTPTPHTSHLCSDALHEKLEDISWVDEQPWRESLVITSQAPTEVADVDDDLERELAFYNQVGVNASVTV